jgi:hypothetical protein
MSTPTTSLRATAFALALAVTLAMLGSMDLLATSQPPAALVAKMAQPVPNV